MVSMTMRGTRMTLHVVMVIVGLLAYRDFVWGILFGFLIRQELCIPVEFFDLFDEFSRVYFAPHCHQPCFGSNIKCMHS